MQSVLITKQNIMFSAWQPNDGTWDFPIVCIWMYMMLEREKTITAFIKPQDQGAKSVDRKAFDAAWAWTRFLGRLSLFFFMRS